MDWTISEQISSGHQLLLFVQKSIKTFSKCLIYLRTSVVCILRHSDNQLPQRIVASIRSLQYSMKISIIIKICFNLCVLHPGRSCHLEWSSQRILGSGAWILHPVIGSRIVSSESCSSSYSVTWFHSLYLYLYLKLPDLLTTWPASRNWQEGDAQFFWNQAGELSMPFMMGENINLSILTQMEVHSTSLLPQTSSFL